MSDLPNPPKPRRGCLFYGCLTCLVCFIAILLAGLIGLHQLKKMLYEYTDDQPMPLPQVQVSPAEAQEIRNRVDSFRDAVQTGRSTAPLELTADQINALLATDPDLKDVRGKIFVSIEGDRLKGQVSVPFTDLGLDRFRGRYLNGTSTFAVHFQNGFLDVRADEIVVKGKPLPKTYMDAIHKQNLAAGANENPRSSAGLNHLQSIEVKEGKLILMPRMEH